MSDLPDLDALLQQALQMQQQLADAQAEAAATEVVGRAGGGAVHVTMTGGGEVLRVRIDPAVVDPAEVELLEDLVLAALHDAAQQAQQLQADAVGDLGGLAALGLGDLGDLEGLGGLGLGGLDPGGDQTGHTRGERGPDRELGPG